MVVAVGGNALTLQDQSGTADQIEANAAVVANGISTLCDAGWRVVVVHGNGPQVGNLAIQQESGAARGPAPPRHPTASMSPGRPGREHWSAPGPVLLPAAPGSRSLPRPGPRAGRPSRDCP